MTESKNRLKLCVKLLVALLVYAAFVLLLPIIGGPVGPSPHWLFGIAMIGSILFGLIFYNGIIYLVIGALAGFCIAGAMVTHSGLERGSAAHIASIVIIALAVRFNGHVVNQLAPDKTG